MTRFGFVIKNLTRRKTRTFFSGFALFVAFSLFGVLMALRQGFGFGVELAGADRLVVINKMSLVQLLPISYWQRIIDIENVSLATHYTWFGGYYQEPRNQLPVMATDASSFRAINDNLHIAEEQWLEWLNNKSGLLVGRTMADSIGWNIGDQVSLGSNIFDTIDGDNIWEFTVEAIYDSDRRGVGEYQAYLRYDYFNEVRAYTKDEVGWFVLKVEDAAHATDTASAIDKMFSNSANETETSTEKGFVQTFASQVGNIGRIISFIMVVVFFTLFLVIGNTIAQSVTERTAEYGVMKTIGFNNARISRMIIMESLVLCLGAGIPGLLFGGLITGALAYLVGDYLPGLNMTGEHTLLGLVLLILLSILAASFPAFRATRLTISSALRRS